MIHLIIKINLIKLSIYFFKKKIHVGNSAFEKPNSICTAHTVRLICLYISFLLIFFEQSAFFFIKLAT